MLKFGTGNMNSFPGLDGFDFVFKGLSLTASNVGGVPDQTFAINYCNKLLPKYDEYNYFCHYSQLQLLLKL